MVSSVELRAHTGVFLFGWGSDVAGSFSCSCRTQRSRLSCAAEHFPIECTCAGRACQACMPCVGLGPFPGLCLNPVTVSETSFFFPRLPAFSRLEVPLLVCALASAWACASRGQQAQVRGTQRRCGWGPHASVPSKHAPTWGLMAQDSEPKCPAAVWFLWPAHSAHARKCPVQSPIKPPLPM